MNKIKLLLSVFFLLNLSSIYSQCALYTFKSGSGSICANDQVTLTALAAQPSYGNGNQGALTVSGTTSVDATRSAVFGAIGVVGSNSIQVASASGFAIGNEVLIISMQDSTKSNLNVTGKYEFRIISAISSNTLTFTQPLVNTYLVNAATKHQVILVPNYSNVTVNNGGLLTCSNWDGTTGGVLCFRANGNLTVNSGGIISASAKGYRGLSHAALWRNKDGAQGEGIYGQGFIGGNSNGSNGYWNLPNGNGGGGGTGTGDAAGGGGGSYGSLGTDGVDWGGHFKGRKGDTISNTGVTRLYFGGAGGEGGGDEDGAYPGKGGNGGGIIYIAAVSITNNGIINSNGETGGNGCNNCGGGGSGMGGGAGGAGGTIELGLNTFSGAGNSIAVSGGTLGTGYGAGNGGAGGNGRIRFDMTSAPPVTTPIAFQGIPNPIAGVTFSWSTGATTSSIVVSPTVTSGYTVVVTSTAACSGLSSSQNLTVNPQTATLTVNTPTVCAGFPATLIASGGGLLPNSIPNLVAYYKFDEGTGGTTADLSGNNLTGTLVNTPVWGASTASILPSAGNALTYNNSNNYVNIADAPILSSLQNSLTIEAWVYPTDNSNNTIIDRANYNFLFATHSNGQPGLGFYNPNTNWQYSTASVPINVWSHVAVTWEHNGTNGILKFYINGVFSNQISINTTLSFNAGNINIGRQEPNSCQCNIFGGKIDEVKVWNISRSQAQIAAGRNFSLHSYSWSGGISNGVPFTPTTSASYTVSNQFGCATPVSVLVSAPPLAISNPSAICPGGGPVVLTASGASSYTWSTGSNNATISVTPSITTTYTVIGTAPNGCFIPEFRTVVVNVVPTISIINPGSFPICESATLTASAPMLGTGGVITYSNGYAIHTFTSTGLFNMPSTGTVEALIVAGGGGGGNDIGGGGGGGGVIYSSNLVVNTGTYNVVIGAGGNGAAAGSGGLGTNGGNSVFNGLTAIGGGRGASKHDANNFPASVGGSGGGASGGGGTGGGTNANYGGANAAGTPGQGNAGGTGAGTWYPGGGGGAGGVGLSAPATGGPGIRYLSLSPYYFGGGGGGAGHDGNSGNGGIGGGGAGGSWNGYVSTGGAGINNGLGGGLGGNMPGGNAGANTGGGGGGGTHHNSNNNGGNGGSGIIIIKYLIPANPVYSYTWSNGANSSSIVVSPSVNTTYSVTLTNTTGCSGNSSVITLSVTPLNIQIVNPGTIPNCTSGTLQAFASGNPVTLTFSALGTSTFVAPAGITSLQYLIVAGGGGGGNDMGGGGGGGGVLYGTTAVTPGQTYTINVGAGGNGAPVGTGQVRGFNGQNSSAFSFTAIGGGGGASTHNNSNSPAGIGGSGGGASGGGLQAGGNGGVNAAGTPGQGNAGGAGAGTWYPGGGGGAGGVGLSQPGTGGPGIQYLAISPLYWAGGGGGSGYSGNGGNGGIGGGGGGAVGVTTGGAGFNNGSAGGGGSQNAQTNTPGGNAGANTGGGGGGGAHYNINNRGGNGGSGIVIIKYNMPSVQNYSYTWSNGGANSSSIVVSPTVNTSYSVVLTNSAGCSANSSPITLSVTPLNILVTASPSLICNGQSATLTASAPILGTGGSMTILNGYAIHTFTNVGASTFTPPSAASVEYLIVAGGGGSGTSNGTGGGGGGGVLTGTTNLLGGQVYTINVGAGGAGTPANNLSTPGNNGQNSSAFSLVALGGGGSGSEGAQVVRNGNVGGSGGGGVRSGLGGAGTAGQGFAGGSNVNDGGPHYSGGGGGGAGAAGTNGSAGTLGVGGNGIQSAISGTATYYGGGGGAGSYSGMASAGAGGLGGGAMGGTNPSDGRNRNGSPNTGGGGAGTGNLGNPGGNGGSGIVIVKYLIPASQNYTYTWSNGGANSSSIVVTPNTNTNYSVVLSNTSGCSSPLISPITLSVTQLQAPITGMSTVCAGITVTLNTAISSTPATGGVITYSNGYTIHTFTSNGTFNAPSNQNIEYLVVAGGGGSGGFGGGGGAGGAILGSANVSGTFAVVVGAGGNGESSPDGGGSNGANSSFNSVVAIGGGTGRHSALGTNGGSGGGNGYGTASPTSSFVAGQGSSGGFGNITGPGYPGGGGGGATSVGGNASANSGGTAGNAGAGLLSSISGAPVYYAVGGPGSARSGGVNGTPATGGSSVGQDGAPNRGNGGGGGLVQWVGKNGGSGVVIIRYQPISVASYTWSNGANTQSITINPTVTTSYSVAFTTTTGCIGTSTLATVNVNPLPVVSISGSSAICVGQTATLVANGANTYTWSNASTASSITLSPASNTSYSLTGTAAGCIGSATRNLTVNANPIITVNSGAICAGQNFTINPNGANTYTIQGGNAVVSPAGNTSYTVAGTSTAGCVSQAFATSNLIVNANPIITVNNGVICAGQNFTINPNGANTYTIQGGSAVVSPTSNASFTVAGTSTAGCLSQAFATSNLTVNPNPTITVNNGTICVGQNFTINPNGANTYTIQGGNAVVSPPSNSSYTVIGTNSVTGCRSQAFATSSLLVNANPIITVNSGAICAGQNFTINPNGANTYTIQGGNAVVSPAGNTSYTVAGTSTAGCVSQAVATSSLIVNQNPTITVNNGAICAGQNFTINPNGANTYTIQGANAVVSPSINTTYTVIGTNTITGCLSQAFATSNLTVNPNPTVSISGASGICTGQNASLTANGATTYTWSTGSNSASIVTTPTANTTYTLTGSTPQGCSSFTTQLVTVQLSLSVSIAGPTTVCYGEPANISGLGGVTYTWNTGATSSTIAPTLTTTTTFSLIGASGTCSNTASTTISVTPNPTITITGTNAICANGSASLTVNGATTYTWSSGSTSASVVFSPSATSVYSVVGSYSTGCLNATTQTVTVYALPVVSISGPSVVCLGDSIALVANGANTYVWNNNATTTTIVITPTTTSTYSAVGTDTNGCVGLSAIDSIFVNPVPILSIISTATAICVGDTVKFTAAGANSYVWNIGDNDSLIVVTPTITTTYSVVGTNGFGCTSTKTDSVKVNALPVLTISGTTGTICLGENITLTANGANTYTWSGGINTNSIAVSPSLSTTYSASGTSTDGCVGSNTLQLNVTECTNIKTIASKAAIKVYPNPNHGEFIIELVSVNNSNITITNVLGQIIKTQKAELMNQIDLNLFDKGIYFINVMENNQSVYRGSIIKE